MSVSASVYTVSTSGATALVTAGADHADVMVRCNAGTVYLGGSNVGSTAGLALTTATMAGQPVRLVPLWPGDILYALGSSAGISVEVLTRG